MGQLKALLSWHSVTLIQYQVESLLAAGAWPVVVVVGHRREEILPHIPTSATIAVNSDYRAGRSSSVKVGLQALSADAAAIAILGVDQPRCPSLLRRLFQHYRRSRALITRPTYKGKHGHPVIFATTLLPELLQITEEGQGLREVVHRHAEEVRDLPVDTREVLLDLNRPEEYRAATDSSGAD